MTKLYYRQAENAVKFQSKGNNLDTMRYSYGHFTLHSELLQSNTNAKFEVNQTGDDKVMLRTKNYSNNLSNSRVKNSTCSGPITP